MTDDDYDALSQKQLASIKRDMRISLEDAAVRATYKVMAELAQPEQEPVVWTEKVGGIGFKDPMLNASYKVTATIAPQRTWVGLTDEEIQECLKGLPTQTIDVYARRIEAKLKELNT
jgi:hypothetical protein